MKHIGKALVLTDGTESTGKIAGQIAGTLKQYEVLIRAAQEFAGNDLLPAEVLFFGCENASPQSFGYVTELLRHINLRGRRCGLFSPESREAIAYLSGLLHDSEAAVYPEPLFADGDPAAWTAAVIGGDYMDSLNLDDFIRKVPDFPKKGVLFYDITSVLTTPRAFAYCIDKMVAMYQHRQIDAVAAIEARGFLFAAPFAIRMGIPLLLIRKKGKLPGKTLSKKYQLEYGEAEIELKPDDVPQGKQVLLMDDLIATGGTLKAAKELLVSAGAQVPEIFGIMGLPFLHYDEILGGTPIQTLITYQSE